MKIGLLMSGHIATRAIAAACQGAGCESLELEPDQMDSAPLSSLEALVVARTAPGVLRSLLLAMPAPCHLIYVSACTVYPSRPAAVPWDESEIDVTGELLPGHGASLWTRECERQLALTAHRRRWTVLRPAIVESPLDPDAGHTRWFVDRLLSGRPLCLPDGDEQPYRHVSTRDVASAVMAVLARPDLAVHRTMNVCPDEVLTPSLHARAVAKALDLELDLKFVDARAWDEAGIRRPMAGRSGCALIKPSPLLRRMGWAPAPAGRFLRNLAKELALQPRRLDESVHARELSLMGEPASVRAWPAGDRAAGWALRTHARDGWGIDTIWCDQPSRGDWNTVAVALGEEVERAASASNLLGIEQALCAPMLLERVSEGSRQLALLCGHHARDATEQCPDLVVVPSSMGLSALLAAPLARLLAAWPVAIPPGDIWVLGRGVEALLAAWLAEDAGRNARVLSIEAERARGVEIGKLRDERGSPALVINVSAAPEGESLASAQLVRDGVLITPFLPTLALAPALQLSVLPDHPSREMLEQALRMLERWQDRVAAAECVATYGLREAGAALAAPALCLPVCSVGEWA